MGSPFQFSRRLRWCAGLLLGGALSVGAAPREVHFSFVMPEADHVYLAGSFNGWELSADSAMDNDNGVWRKTLRLDDGTYAYNFKAEGAKVSASGWLLDWKSARGIRKLRGRASSTLVVPDDLDAFHARQQAWTETDGAIEIPLFYDRYPDKNAASRPSGYGHQPVRTVPPLGDWKLPEGLAALQPLFTLVRLGDSKHLAVIARKVADDPYYNRILFDRNGNGDLTDDDPLDGVPRSYGGSGGYFDCSFPAIDLEIDVGGRKMPYGLGLRLSGRMPAPNAEEDEDFGSVRNLHVMVSPQCAYLGEFALDGVGYRVALGDATGNGRFDDRAAQPENAHYADSRLFAVGDSFHLTTDDEFDREGLPFGQHLVIGERLFEVRPDLAAGRLILTPRKDNVGTLELSGPMQSLALLSADDGQIAMLANAGARVPLPAGGWRLLEYQQIKKDEWGDEWLLSARGSEEAKPVAVPAGGAGRLAAGEPLQAIVEIYDRYLQLAVTSGTLRIALGLAGCGKEQITDLRRVSGTNTQHKLAKRYSNRPQEATYRIIKPDGELVTSGSFEYG